MRPFHSTSLIVFQNIIPISLYISIEFVKTFQAYFIWQDSDMYDIELDQFCTPKTVSNPASLFFIPGALSNSIFLGAKK
jgi:magnesium-transporting ATPase (P-type)